MLIDVVAVRREAGLLVEAGYRLVDTVGVGQCSAQRASNGGNIFQEICRDLHEHHFLVELRFQD
jgi:hypothetical protein